MNYLYICRKRLGSNPNTQKVIFLFKKKTSSGYGAVDTNRKLGQTDRTLIQIFTQTAAVWSSGNGRDVEIRQV